MRGKSEYPTTHGDQHAADGSDPIPGIGVALHWGTNVATDTTYLDLDFGTGGGWNVESRGGGLNWSFEGGGWTLDTGDGGLVWDLGLGGWSMSLVGISWSLAGDFDLTLAAGKTFTVRDHLNAVKIRWTEGTNDLHIPTGGTVVADL